MAQNFDWNNLSKNLAEGTLEDKKKGYEVDSRFYKLARNENDQGGALVRFIPDAEGIMFVKMTRVAANQGHERRFINDWSPQSIGLPDPVNERFLELWNKGEKEEAKRFGRTFRYISNIKIIKDPSNPENEGKIFLLDMSKTIFEKVKGAAAPTADEIALGTEPKAVFNPLEGNSFLMKVKRGTNNFITYDDSKFDEKITPAYASLDEYNADIKANGYILNDFYKVENFPTYEELKDKMKWYLGETTTQAPAAPEALTPATPAPVAPVTPVATPAPVAAVAPVTPAPVATPAAEVDELDGLLAEFE